MVSWVWPVLPCSIRFVYRCWFHLQLPIVILKKVGTNETDSHESKSNNIQSVAEAVSATAPDRWNSWIVGTGDGRITEWKIRDRRICTEKMLCDQKQSRLDWGCRARDVEKNERNATSVGTAAATGVAAATGKKSHPPPERRQPMIRHSSPSAKKKKKISIPAASWPTINRNRPQQPRSSANFWPTSRSMKTHPPCWNPTAAIRSKLISQRPLLLPPLTPRCSSVNNSNW